MARHPQVNVSETDDPLTHETRCKADAPDRDRHGDDHHQDQDRDSSEKDEKLEYLGPATQRRRHQQPELPRQRGCVIAFAPHDLLTAFTLRARIRRAFAASFLADSRAAVEKSPVSEYHRSTE